MLVLFWDQNFENQLKQLCKIDCVLFFFLILNMCTFPVLFIFVVSVWFVVSMLAFGFIILFPHLVEIGCYIYFCLSSLPPSSLLPCVLSPPLCPPFSLLPRSSSLLPFPASHPLCQNRASRYICFGFLCVLFLAVLALVYQNKCTFLRSKL